MRVAGVALSYAQQRIAADMQDALAFINNADAAGLADGYKEALNLVKWAYWRERTDVRSAGSLALGHRAAIDNVNALAATLDQSEAADVARVKLTYRAAASRLGQPYVETPVLSAAEQAASRLVPSRNPNPPANAGGRTGGAGAGGGGNAAAAPAQPTLSGYYTQEANNFADGQRSILEIRNAISAEFGPVPVENVVNYFRNLERLGSWVVR
jgi:hypothetical protein